MSINARTIDKRNLKPRSANAVRAMRAKEAPMKCNLLIGVAGVIVVAGAIMPTAVLKANAQENAATYACQYVGSSSHSPDEVLAWSDSSIAGDAPTAAEIRHEHEEYVRMLDVHLAIMKAQIKLTHDQENNWRQFEAVVHSAANAHLDAMMEMLARLEAGEKPSPIEHVRTIADHMAKSSVEVKNVADAAEPLFESLTIEQKRIFGPLLQKLVERLPHAGTGLYLWCHDMVAEPD